MHSWKYSGKLEIEVYELLLNRSKFYRVFMKTSQLSLFSKVKDLKDFHI